jgi:uncharacterized delta-60 repeat protein
MKTFIPRLGSLAALLAIVLSTCVASAAAPTGFGNGGYAIWESGGAPNALGVQRGGRIVFSSGLHVSALTASGAHDRHFTSQDLRDAECDDGYCFTDLALQPDDRIVVAGEQSVVRLMRSGALDPSFGIGGRASVPGIRIQSIALAPSGAIVVAGAHVDANGSTGEVGGPSSIARLLPSGILDPSFGRGGSTALDARVGWPVAVGVQPNGGVVVVKLRSGGGSPLSIARLRADGSLDTEFGESGLTTVPRLEATAVGIQSDGGIVVGGLRWPAVPGSGHPLATFARLDGRGRPDVAYGQDGVAILRDERSSGHVDIITALALEPNGGAVAVGSSVNASSSKGSFAFLGKITRDGQAAHFAYLGSGLLDPDSDCFSEGAGAVTVQPDAKIVVGGWACESGAWVARYMPGLRPDAGEPLRIRRVRPSGSAPVRAASAGAVVRLTTTVRSGAPSHVAVSVRRAELFKAISGKKHPVPTGGRVALLPGSVVGGVRLQRRARTVEADSSRTGRLALRLRLPTRAFPRGGWGLVTVRALDDRGRTASLEIEFVAR